ncbi:SDR family NAD(P)-dependent oxidoreductase [Flavobacterium sp. 5]|uniref:SDR family NAD(P)-dependent oxidoreductase n=1 Tax=Flavobacterium sp. 5 TaxID=2035199 RepID=UPI000C2B569B|nr:SDR family NAD(P)-dependent oxidoreductase [Flavobacterium sp. 5]PKB18441.1 NAD(P)-dependent dehydrogenase (short-subunit alcohol dehydrogenase family) [Flavobacterium sp. 5]
MKTALITGGTSGIGLSIAKELILLDFKVLIVGKNRERGKAAEQELNAKRAQCAQFVELDLSNMKNVNQFSDQFMKEHKSLDVLANIAGVMLPKRQETAEGLEMTFAVNYLSGLVLSTKLAPLLEKTEGSRIVNVGGPASQNLKPVLNFDDLQSVKKYNGLLIANKTVHAKSVLTQLLSEKYASKNIDVISFAPGLIRSNLGNNMPLVMRILFKLMSPMMSDTSTTGVEACSSKELQGVTGILLEKKKQTPIAFEKNYKEKLWLYSEELITKIMN